MPPAETPDILLIRQTRPDVAGRLAERFRLHRMEEAPDREAFLDAVGPRIQALAVGAMCPIDAALFDRLPRLEIVASFGVGYDTIDAVEAQRRGIVVTHTPDVLSDEVADLALGLLLATLRRIPQADRYLRAGHWRAGSFPLTTSLRERRVGILGLGRIGRAIARRLEGFGVTIAYYGRTPRADVPYAYHDSLLGLAQAVDTLIVAAPGGPGTQGIVDAGVLAALGPDGIVVNIARGSVIDEPALIAALQAGTILGAGLDVFANEPQVPQALIDLDQTVLLPHVGSGSHHTRAAMGRMLTDNLFSWFDGKGPVTPVPETPWTGQR